MYDKLHYYILGGMARAIFVTCWAAHEEKHGRFYHWQELTEVFPATSLEAVIIAAGLAGRIVESNGCSLSVLYSRTVTENKLAQESSSTAGGDTPYDFGFCLALEAMGAGVNWKDSNEPHGYHIPSIECSWRDVTPNTSTRIKLGMR